MFYHRRTIEPSVARKNGAERPAKDANTLAAETSLRSRKECRDSEYPWGTIVIDGQSHSVEVIMKLEKNMICSNGLGLVQKGWF